MIEIFPTATGVVDWWGRTIFSEYKLDFRILSKLRKEVSQYSFTLLGSSTDGEFDTNIDQINIVIGEKLIDDVLRKQEEEKRKGEKLRFINYRIYLNTLKKAFSSISEIETNAKFYQEDKGDHLEIRITIPKNENKTKTVAAD